jgi:NitT/TauT family transport system substrate-binding protein
METALESGTIDAAATWYPTVSLLLRNLRGRAVLFEDDTYLMTWNLVSQQDFAKKNSESVKKILKGLLKAQNYIKKKPGEAIAITAQFSRVDPAVLKDIWRNYNYNVRLEEGLLMNLEDQSRWALNYYDTGRKTIPDFNDFIYTEGLRSINPASVTIRGNPER